MFKKIFAIAIIAAATLCVGIQAQDLKLEPNICKASNGNNRVCTDFRADVNKATEMHKKDLRHPDPFDGVELTADQKDKLDKMAKKDAKKRDSLRQKAAKERKEKAAKRDKEIKKILTAEQYAKYQANIKDIKAKRHNPRNGFKPGDKRHRHHKHGNKDIRRDKSSCPAPGVECPAPCPEPCTPPECCAATCN